MAITKRVHVSFDITVVMEDECLNEVIMEAAKTQLAGVATERAKLILTAALTEGQEEAANLYCKIGFREIFSKYMKEISCDSMRLKASPVRVDIRK